MAVLVSLLGEYFSYLIRISERFDLADFKMQPYKYWTQRLTLASSN
jgi:hypothetical protein